MRLRWRGLACLCLCGVLVWFLADAGDVRADTKDALVLCARSVIPSLVPFLVISSLLLSLGFGQLTAPWLAGLMEPLFRVPGAAVRRWCWVSWRLPHRGRDRGGPVPGEPGLPGGGGAAAGLLQQFQPRLPHQRAGGRRVRQRADRSVAVADPRALRPADGAGIPGKRKSRRPAAGGKARPFPGGPLRPRPSGGGPVRPLRNAVCVRLRGVLLCAGQAAGRSGRAAGAGPGGRCGALLPDAAADGGPLRPCAGGWGRRLGRPLRPVPDLAVLEGSGLRLRNCLLGKAVQCAFSLLLAALLAGYVLGKRAPPCYRV